MHLTCATILLCKSGLWTSQKIPLQAAMHILKKCIHDEDGHIKTSKEAEKVFVSQSLHKTCFLSSKGRRKKYLMKVMNFPERRKMLYTNWINSILYNVKRQNWGFHLWIIPVQKEKRKKKLGCSFPPWEYNSDAEEKNAFKNHVFFKWNWSLWQTRKRS